MDEQQRQAFENAVEKKKEQSRIASEQTRADGPENTGPVSQDVQDAIIKQGSQDANSPRDKNSQHGKVTADKWNQ